MRRAVTPPPRLEPTEPRTPNGFSISQHTGNDEIRMRKSLRSFQLLLKTLTDIRATCFPLATISINDHRKQYNVMAVEGLFGFFTITVYFGSLILDCCDNPEKRTKREIFYLHSKNSEILQACAGLLSLVSMILLSIELSYENHNSGLFIFASVLTAISFFLSAKGAREAEAENLAFFLKQEAQRQFRQNSFCATGFDVGNRPSIAFNGLGDSSPSVLRPRPKRRHAQACLPDSHRENETHLSSTHAIDIDGAPSLSESPTNLRPPIFTEKFSGNFSGSGSMFASPKNKSTTTLADTDDKPHPPQRHNTFARKTSKSDEETPPALVTTATSPIGSQDSLFHQFQQDRLPTPRVSSSLSTVEIELSNNPSPTSSH